MSYDVSYDTAKARRYRFLLDELMSLCNTVPHTTSQFGRPIQFPLSTLFVLLGLKFDSGLGYRDFVAYLDFNPFLLHRLGLQQAPSYSSLHKALNRLDTRLIHQMYALLARKSPPPRKLAVDSSGFSHSSGGEWRSVRFKTIRKRRFHALHNVVDTDTLMVHASHVRVRPGGDAKHMISLVKRVQTSGLETLYGDKGYLSKKNVQFIADLGAYAAIEPKKNARTRSRGSPAYGRLVREYRADPEMWKQTHGYGTRSLVETVFSMMKMKYGEGLSSRGHRERRRELLIKVVLHNVERLNYLGCAGR